MRVLCCEDHENDHKLSAKAKYTKRLIADRRSRQKNTHSKSAKRANKRAAKKYDLDAHLGVRETIIESLISSRITNMVSQTSNHLNGWVGTETFMNKLTLICEQFFLSLPLLKVVKTPQQFMSWMFLTIRPLYADSSLIFKLLKWLISTYHQIFHIDVAWLEAVEHRFDSNPQQDPDFTNLEHLERYRRQIHANPLEAHYGAKSTFESFIETFSLITTQWEVVKNSKFFSVIGDFLSVILAAGFLSKNRQFSFTVKGFELFRIYAQKGHASTLNVVESMINTVRFLIERGWRCFQEGSIAPFLFEDDEAITYEKEYSDIVADYGFVKLGLYEKSTVVDAQDFELRLTNIITKTEAILKNCAIPDRNFMRTRLERLKKLRVDFETTRVSGGLREAPYGFLVYGPSAVGKSTIVNNLVVYALQCEASNRGCENPIIDPDTICTLNSQEKYHSDYKSYTRAVILDDLANANFDHTESNPTEDIINFINNVKRTAIQAEADMKGKVPINPKIVAATTNVWERWASVFSNEPVSILRRFDRHIVVRVKKDWLVQNGSSTMINKEMLSEAASRGDYFPDAWEFDVMYCYGATQIADRDGRVTAKDLKRTKDTQNKNGQKVVWEFSKFVDQDGEHKKAESIGVSQLLTIIKNDIASHFRTQQSVLHSSKQIFERKLCDHGMISQHCSQCLHAQWGEEAYNRLYQEYLQCKNSNWNSWVAWMPKTVYDSTLSHRIMMMCYERTYFSSFIQFSRYYFSIGSLIMMLLGQFGIFFGLPFLVVMWFLTLGASLKLRSEILFKRLQEERENMPQIFKRIRDLDRTRVAQVVGVLMGAYAMLKLYKYMNSNDAQGSAFSLPEEKENVWMKPKIEPLPKHINLRNQYDHLRQIVEGNLCYIEIGEGKSKFCNALWITSNCLLIPNHMIPEKRTQIYIVSDTTENVTGRNFVTRICKDDCVKVEGDLALAYVPSSGSKKNILKWFPTDFVMRRTFCQVLHRNSEGIIREETVYSSPRSDVTTANSHFTHALECEYSQPTFKGQCISTHLHKNEKGAYIVGFHLAGRTGYNYGALQQVTQKELQNGIDTLQSKSHVLVAHAEGEFTTKEYDVDYTPIGEPHPKCPTNFMEANYQVTDYGRLPLDFHRSSTKSAVVDSPITKEVTEIMGYPQKWGPPPSGRNGESKAPGWKAYSTYLSKVGVPQNEFYSDVLDWAVKDMITEYDDFLATDSGKELLSKIHILNDVDTISGKKGVKFVDAIKKSTSLGFPLKGAKGVYMTEETPTEEHPNPSSLDKKFWDRANELISHYQDGERDYPVFKACTKDEPTKLTKEKERVFQAAPIALQLVVRKYLLTLMSFLSHCPLVSECAVGVNSQGPQWTVLNEHMTRYGKDNIVAGDFASFDTAMSARMSMASFKIVLHLCKKAGYSEADLRVVNGLATEICFPVINLNGELISLFGSNPSGQNMTVYTNSIVNSLYHRCAFREIYPTYEGKFSDVVSLMTYGDDCKMSVRRDIVPKYNHTEIQRVFASYGITYTMPDKEAASRPFVHTSESEFLKRDSIEQPDLTFEWNGKEYIVQWSKLTEDSIFKSLHSNMLSKELSREEVSIETIQSALLEWFFYGKETHDMRYKQLCQILELRGWTGLVHPNFHLPWESKLAQWCLKYDVKLNGVLISPQGEACGNAFETIVNSHLDFSDFSEGLILPEEESFSYPESG